MGAFKGFGPTNDYKPFGVEYYDIRNNIVYRQMDFPRGRNWQVVTTESSSNNSNSTTGIFIQPGLNTYTGGTSTYPTINVSGLTLGILNASGNSVFTGTLSGGSSFSANTLYSGSTNLYDIFAGIGSIGGGGGQTTSVQPGLNTYTGGTSTSPSVNISALTINTLTASGNSIVSANFSATTIYSGSSNLYQIFSPIGHSHQFSSVLNTGHTHTVSEISNLSSSSIGVLSLSATTFYSGSTNLSSIFSSQVGSAATISVGTVSTLSPGSSATVVNVGTTSAAVFNFGIPRGDTGASGSTTIGTTVYCSNESELRNAVQSHSAGTVMNIIVCNDIGLTSSLDLPKSTTARNKKLSINLGGNAIYDNSVSGLSYLIGRIPTGQTEALNVMQSWGLHLYNGTLQGKGSQTGTLLDLGSTYNSNVHDVYVKDAQYGIWYKFCLMSTIRNCMSNNIFNTPFLLDNGDWTGAGLTNAQSNHSLIEQCRVFNNDNAFAAFKIIGASGTIVRQSISEGGSPSYHIYWDALNSSVVKDGKLDTIHLESTSSVCGIRVSLGSGYFVMDGVFSQYDNIIEAVSSSGYPHFYVKNIPWFTSGSYLKTSGTNAIWSFEECIFNASGSSIWVGGVMPYYWYQEGFNQSKFANYAPEMKFNNINVP